MICTKYQAAEFFKPIYDDLLADKTHNGSLAHGISFMGRYAYLVNDVCCGRLAVHDNIPNCKVFWDYDKEIAVNLSDSLRDRIRGYTFLRRGGKVLFLRKRDIAAVIPKLTPLKKSKSILRFHVTEDNIEVRAIKQNLVLQYHAMPKKISAHKNVSIHEDFIGDFDVNLLYFEKMSLENFDESGIIGIRLSESSDTMQVFVRGSVSQLDWVLRIKQI